MEYYEQPELLEKEEYEKYKCYFHMTKKATDQLRKTLNTLGSSLMDVGVIAMLKNGEVVIEIPLTDDKNCSQTIMKKEDFKINHSIDEVVLKLDVILLRMRIGGVNLSKNLKTFSKDEFRFIVDEDGDFDMG